MAGLFKFNLGNWSTFVSYNPKDIIETVYDYYGKERGYEYASPSLEEIKPIDHLDIPCYFPMCIVHQKIRIAIPDITLHVNANAFDYAKELFRDFAGLKRGKLYKVMPSPDGELGYFYLPEESMKRFSDYNWAQHQEQVSKWLLERDFKRHDLDTRSITVTDLPV